MRQSLSAREGYQRLRAIPHCISSRKSDHKMSDDGHTRRGDRAPMRSAGRETRNPPCEQQVQRLSGSGVFPRRQRIARARIARWMRILSDSAGVGLASVSAAASATRRVVRPHENAARRMTGPALIGINRVTCIGAATVGGTRVMTTIPSATAIVATACRNAIRSEGPATRRRRHLRRGEGESNKWNDVRDGTAGSPCGA